MCDALQILPWLSYSVPGVLNLGGFTLETGAALWCFLLCVIVDPGRYNHLHSVVAPVCVIQTSERVSWAAATALEGLWLCVMIDSGKRGAATVLSFADASAMSV